MATTPTKTIQTPLLAWTDIASTAGTVSVGTAVDISTIWAAAVGIRLGRQSGSAFTAGWPNIRVECSTTASGNNSWIPVYNYQMQLGATLANTTLTAQINASDATFAVTANTNIAAGDLVYIKDASAANYELVRVKLVSNLTITPEEPLVNHHDNSSQVTDQAEEVWASFDLSTYKRLRYVVDNAGGGQAFAAEITLITFDSF